MYWPGSSITIRFRGQSMGAVMGESGADYCYIIVVNLMQNDSWLVHMPEHPSSHIICALGNMDATREGSPWPGYVTRAPIGQRAAGYGRQLRPLYR